MAFSNVLPDPVNKITAAGVYDNSTGTAGPGFASVSLRSVRDTQVSRTISGRAVTRSQGAQNWEIDIQYNPLTRDEFEPVYSFLLSRNARKTPFFVALPEYAAPRDATFATAASTYPIYLDTAASAGATNIIVKHLNISGDPKSGDMFTITDANDTNHLKAYRITRVENSTVYETSGLASTQRRIHFVPPLSRATSIGLTAKTTTSASGNTYALASHGLSNGQQIRVSAAGSALTLDQVYYIINSTTNSFSVAATSGGTQINTSSLNITFIPIPTIVNFTNPKVRCILKSDVQEYAIGTNNLFQFGLSLEEVQP